MEKKFHNPKLLIVNYYDSLIQQIDIYIEQLFEKYNKNDLLPDPIYYSVFKNNLDFKNNQNIEIPPDEIEKSVKIVDYIEVVRDKSIEEIKKVQQANLQSYESNKERYKYDRKSLTHENVEEMRRGLFGDKFCFVLEIDDSIKHNKPIINQCTVVTDFYVDMVLYKWFLKVDNNQKDYYNRITKRIKLDNTLNIILDEKSLMVYLVKEYFNELISRQIYGTEVITITKASLFGINSTIKCRIERINGVCFPKTSDLSFIKSLRESMYEIKDLSGLKNLEYLYIENKRINSSSFNGLDKLIQLCVKNLLSEQLEPKINVDDLKSLKILTISNLYYPIDLKCLKNLTHLSIYFLKDISLIKNLPNGIDILEIKHSDIDENVKKADRFFKDFPNLSLSKLILENNLRLLKVEWFTGIRYIRELILENNLLMNLDFLECDCFASLEKLDISSNKIKALKKGIFSKLKKLEYLKLTNNKLERLDFLQCDCLEKAEELDFSYNNIKILKEGVFSKLINLKKFNLDNNTISVFESSVFQGLSNLEFLSLNSLNGINRVYHESFRLEKDSFNGLTNLRNLEISYNILLFEQIDPILIFSHMPMLESLCLFGCQIKLEKNIFSELKHLKEIWLNYNDYYFFDKCVLDSLESSNVKIKM